MKLHLPKVLIGTLLSTMASVAMADVLTGNTIYTGESSNLIEKYGYTYDGGGKKYDLSFIGSTGRIFTVSSSKPLTFQGIKTLTISDSESTDTSAALLLTGRNWGKQTAGVQIIENGVVNITNNTNKIESTASSAGGGIFKIENSGVNINYNDSVSFSGNKIISERDNTNKPGSVFVFFSDQAKGSAGRYVYDTFNMSGNGDVTFQGNSLTHEKGSGRGGAMDLCGAAQLNTSPANPHYYNITHVNWEGNSNITFDKNTVSSGGEAFGGAIVMSNVNHTISDTKGKVSFTNNTVSSTANEIAHNSYGGAIYMDSGTDTRLNIINNNEVEFSGNTATATGSNTTAQGGAIRSWGQTQELKISGNNKVLFSGNGVIHEALDNEVKGGAIYGGFSTEITNNKEVTFEKNYEKGKSALLLRSLYIEGGDLKLSAAEGGNITFHDTIKVAEQTYDTGWSKKYELGTGYGWPTPDIGKYAAGTYGGNLVLNEGEDQTGKIVFSGKYTEEHLKDIKGTAVTATEITSSRTSDIEGKVTLYKGTLSLEDNAILKAGEGVDIQSGATLAAVNTNAPEISLSVLAASVSISTTEVTTHNDTAAATLSADLSMADGSALTLEYGHFNLNNNDLTLGTGIALNFSVLDEVADGDSMVLFSNVSSVNFKSGDLASEYFTGMGIGADTTLEFVNDTVILANMSGSVVPEPATATLSLLALVAMAARRRRR